MQAGCNAIGCKSLLTPEAGRDAVAALEGQIEKEGQDNLEQQEAWAQVRGLDKSFEHRMA